MLKNIQVRILLLLLFTTIVSVNGRQTSRFARAVWSPTSKLDVSGNVHQHHKDWPIYHATTAEFLQFKEIPTWFSPDFLEGFKLVAVKQTSASGVIPDVYIKKCNMKENIDLFAMKPYEAASKAELEKLGVPKDKINTNWYGKTASMTKDFVDAFCSTLPSKGLFGWRNWWDQDEIMLCPPIAQKIKCSSGFFCQGRELTKLVGHSPVDKKPYTFVVKDEEVQGKSHRYSFFILDTSVVKDTTMWTIDQFAAEDKAADVFIRACVENDELDAFVAKQMYKKTMQELQEKFKIKVRPLPFLSSRVKEKIVSKYQQLNPGRPGLTWDDVLAAYEVQQITLEQINAWRAAN